MKGYGLRTFEISILNLKLLKVLFSEGDGRAVLRAISMPLQRLGEAVWHRSMQNIATVASSPASNKCIEH